jgi:hypothetical protein
MGLNHKKLHGRGRLVPMRQTGIAYHVQHGIQRAAVAAQYCGSVRPGQWTKCFVHFASEGIIPNGSYFLYGKEGGVHQLGFSNGQWYYLAAAAY